jgi:hypothetical protein
MGEAERITLGDVVIQLPHFEVQSITVDDGGYELCTSVLVNERDRGTRVSIYMQSDIDEDESPADVAKRALMEFFAHELDECFRCAKTGALLNDPHDDTNTRSGAEGE